MGRTAEEAQSNLAEVVLALFEHLVGPPRRLRNVRFRIKKGAFVTEEPLNIPDDTDCELTLFGPDEEGRYHGALRVLSSKNGQRGTGQPGRTTVR